MGQINLAGIVGPKGEKPSIYSLTSRENMNIVTTNPTIRDVTEHLTAYEEIDTEYALFDAGELRNGHIAKAQLISKSYGFENKNKRASKVYLFKLSSWNSNFFYHFPICFMHEFAHGINTRLIVKPKS